jgi:hypothetical protein
MVTVASYIGKISTDKKYPMSISNSVLGRHAIPRRLLQLQDQVLFVDKPHPLQIHSQVKIRQKITTNQGKCHGG